MTKRDIVNLHKFIIEIRELESTEESNEFKYTIACIINAITPELEAIIKMKENIEAIIYDYYCDRNILLKEYGEVTEDGKSYRVLSDSKNIVVVREKLIELEEKYKVSLDIYRRNSEDFIMFLETPSSVILPKLEVSYIPKYFTSKDMAFLIKIGVLL